MKKSLIALATIFILVSCNQISRVEKFEYMGMGDTIFAVIYGEVYQLENFKKVPLKDVLITADSIDKSTKTNEKGLFELGFPKGKYKITIHKNGYQTITINNYTSYPDEISETKIILVKGNSFQNFICPQSKCQPSTNK